MADSNSPEANFRLGNVTILKKGTHIQKKLRTDSNETSPFMPQLALDRALIFAPPLGFTSLFNARSYYQVSVRVRLVLIRV